jgi:hypothetical protein
MRELWNQNAIQINPDLYTDLFIFTDLKAETSLQLQRTKKFQSFGNHNFFIFIVIF